MRRRHQANVRRQRCTLQILLWDGGTAWNLAFEEPVHSYKFGKSSGKRVLQAEHDFATGRVTRPAIRRSASTRPPSCPRPSERSEGRARFGQERQLLFCRCPAENCVAVWKATEAINDRLMPKREIEPKRLPERGE